MWADILLGILTIICVVTDLHTRKIYNIVVFPGIAAAVIGHGLAGGIGGLGQSLLGFVAGFSILFIPYLMGGIGAGDVKLLALIGALKGTYFVFVASVYMAVIGGLMAIIFLVFRNQSRQFFKEVITVLAVRRQGVRIAFPVRSKQLSAVMPYGVAIGGGTAMAWFLKGAFVL